MNNETNAQIEFEKWIKTSDFPVIERYEEFRRIAWAAWQAGHAVGMREIAIPEALEQLRKMPIQEFMAWALLAETKGETK